ncbi:MAG: tRNA lysidine(34) synthetase TilS [Deltaproteobacteria bacterium RIFOXYD12_FULL_57_12]|nr:MAG: tRNA lysidine(34) synthetase TilS [Deltaproteobacteria bacterium RIFOXYD12_FULL_57_12]
MHPLEKQTAQLLEREKLIAPGEKVLVAVSAGPDSMALLHVLARLAGPLGFSLVATYVNHGLRPAEAAREEELVRASAANLGLPCEIGRVATRPYAKEQKLSLEHAARLLRYETLEKNARQHQATKIALAHTADDQAEEILLRLIRGTGRPGLAGMKLLRAGRFLRPFLKIPKDSLLAYLAERHIPFLEDSSNHQQNFLRNRIRLQLLPFLSEHFNAGIRQTLLQTADILQEEEALLAALTTEAWHKVIVSERVDPQENGPLNAPPSATPPPLALDLSRLAEQPLALRRRLLEAACWQMGNEPRFRNINRLMQLLESPGQQAGLHFADGLRVNKTATWLIFSYPKGRTRQRGNLAESLANTEAIIIPGPGNYFAPQFAGSLQVDVADRLPDAGKLADPGIDFLDLALVAFPLVLRGPRPGDRFLPLGAPGSKKVHDFLADRKIPEAARRRTPVLVSAGAIAALPGLRIDHRFRITAATTRVLILRWKKTDKG